MVASSIRTSCFRYFLSYEVAKRNGLAFLDPSLAPAVHFAAGIVACVSPLHLASPSLRAHRSIPDSTHVHVKYTHAVTCRGFC